MSYYSNFLTAGQVISASRAETLGSTRTAISAIADTPLLDHLDWINKDFFQSAFTDYGTEGWSWSVNEYTIQTVSNIKTTAIVTPASTTITVDTNIDPNSGVGILYIKLVDGGYDVVSYSSYAANVFTIDTTKSKPTATHAIGATIGFMYSLPTDFGRLNEIYVNNSYSLNESKKGLFPDGGYYKIWGNSILFQDNFGSEIVNIIYQRKPVTLVDTDSILIIPSEFRRYAIEKMNAFIYAKRLKRQDAQLSEDKALIHLQKAFSFDINNNTDESVYADF
jgi:hypothetical protein